MATKINLAEKFARFDAHWQPKVVADLDDHEIKIVKVLGDFVWHKHADDDELFIVISGELDMDFRDRRETLGPG